MPEKTAERGVLVSGENHGDGDTWCLRTSRGSKDLAETGGVAAARGGGGGGQERKVLLLSSK